MITVRARLIVVLLAALAGALLLVSPARAGDEHTDEGEVTPTTLIPGSVNIGDGFAFTGAVVTSPGEEPVEHDAMYAAVWVQSWLPTSIFGEPALQGPPPELPVHRLEVSGQWGFTPGTLTQYFATDGETAWVALPANQTPTTEPVTPPEPADWFVAEPRVIGAFNGTEELVPTAGTEAPTEFPTAEEIEERAAAAADADDDSSAVPWIIGGGVVVLLGAGLFLRRRSSTT